MLFFSFIFPESSRKLIHLMWLNCVSLKSNFLAKNWLINYPNDLKILQLALKLVLSITKSVSIVCAVFILCKSEFVCDFFQVNFNLLICWHDHNLLFNAFFVVSLVFLCFFRSTRYCKKPEHFFVCSLYIYM